MPLESLVTESLHGIRFDTDYDGHVYRSGAFTAYVNRHCDFIGNYMIFTQFSVRKRNSRNALSDFDDRFSLDRVDAFLRSTNVRYSGSLYSRDTSMSFVMDDSSEQLVDYEHQADRAIVANAVRSSVHQGGSSGLH
ncbi:unnamed protein product [Heligmosomoides polygyrus]|uniref:Uncharacterized protein n=1 Tax=Heligmosomoides polygyrus TaxID=6339 RepID=A0A3P8C4G4_HELPZ|nr:unnamed protein product [Heligmosomoides polygyrus]